MAWTHAADLGMEHRAISADYDFLYGTTVRNPGRARGRDVVCCAQTGSGKTAAFLFPIIGRMMKTHDSPVGSRDIPFEGKVEPDTLVSTPTRELRVQTFEEARKCRHRTPYRVARVYGGEKPKDQMIVSVSLASMS